MAGNAARIRVGLGLCAAVISGAANAASTTASLKVGLTLAASCRVESATLTSHGTPRATREAAVHCDPRAPHALHISTALPGAVLQREVGESQTAAGPVRIVTLVF